MGQLDGKVAIITGAARGQGAAAARLFVEEGARVVIADVNDEAGKELASELGDAAFYRHLDVSAEDEWSTVVGEAVESLGGLHVLVNNAGVLHFSSVADTTLADYERVVRTNQFGCFLGIRAAARVMQSGGSIVTIGSSTSIAGLFGIPVKNYLTEKGPDGRDRPLPREKFYIPGSLLKVGLDNTNPLAFGMPSTVDVFFDSSPVFKL